MGRYDKTQNKIVMFAHSAQASLDSHPAFSGGGNASAVHSPGRSSAERLLGHDAAHASHSTSTATQQVPRLSKGSSSGGDRYDNAHGTVGALDPATLREADEYRRGIRRSRDSDDGIKISRRKKLFGPCGFLDGRNQSDSAVRHKRSPPTLRCRMQQVVGTGQHGLLLH
ncbi:hypothetical protein MRB53_038260 [Persea americana]|nr:hypothetical protein MRB53_038260 [Persea americana]